LLHRNIAIMSLVPLVLIGALVLVLAPACTMPGCGAFMGLAGMAEHGCQDYMMVDDTPDGVAASQAPVIAVIAHSETPTPTDVVASTPVVVECPQTPEYDPLGVRIQV
jgi:hypothetical protein